jgi:predicted CopG family antitoxin
MEVEVRKEKESKTIRISREHYDKIVELGDMTKSFDNVVGIILKQADVNTNGKSMAGAALNKEKEE